MYIVQNIDFSEYNYLCEPFFMDIVNLGLDGRSRILNLNKFYLLYLATVISIKYGLGYF